jgi:hypothetical protein
MKPFTMVAIFLMALAAVAQATRFLMGWELMIGTTMIPMWVSLCAAVVLAVVAFMVWREHSAHGHHAGI